MSIFIFSTPLVLFILPIYLLQFKITSEISFNLLEVFLFLNIFINFFILLKNYSLKKIFSLLKISKNIFLPITLILAGFLISFLYNQQLTSWKNWSDGLGKLLDLIILPILFGTSTHLLSHLHSQNPLALTKEKAPILLKLLSLLPLGLVSTISYYLSASLIAFLGIFAWFTHHLTFDNRLALFFQSPNQLATFLAPALIIGLSFLFSQFNKKASTSLKRYWLLYSSILILIINIFLTKSLGSWLAIFFIILLLLSYHHIINNKITANCLTYFQKYSSTIIFILIFSNILFIVNTDLFLSATHYHPNILPTSYDSRLTIYQVDQKILSTNWLSGIGINNFQNIYLHYQKYFPAYPQWAVPHAHNNLIHFWIEGGLLAGLGLLLIYLNIINPHLKQKVLPIETSSKQKMDSRPSLTQLSMPQLTLLYFIIHGFVDTTIWTPATATFFWFTVIYYLSNNPKN